MRADIDNEITLLNGIWSVEIATNDRTPGSTLTIGSGLIVLNWPELLGGDDRYLYIGRIVKYDDEVEVRIRLKHYKGPRLALFNSRADGLNVLAYGKIETCDKLRLAGNVAEIPTLEVSLNLAHRMDPS